MQKGDKFHAQFFAFRMLQISSGEKKSYHFQVLFSMLIIILCSASHCIKQVRSLASQLYPFRSILVAFNVSVGLLKARCAWIAQYKFHQRRRRHGACGT